MRAVAIIFFIASLILTIAGFYVMFTYGDYDSEYNRYGSKTGHIVGGDAYNFIIIGVRGLGFIIAGLTSALVGSVMLILEKIESTRVKSSSESKELINTIGIGE